MIPVRAYRIRKANSRSNSVEITLPHDWVKENGLKAGDTVVVLVKDSYLVIAPSVEELSKVVNGPSL